MCHDRVERNHGEYAGVGTAGSCLSCPDTGSGTLEAALIAAWFDDADFTFPSCLNRFFGECDGTSHGILRTPCFALFCLLLCSIVRDTSLVAERWWRWEK